MLDRRKGALDDVDAGIARRVVEARVLTAVAVLARKRPPTRHDIYLSIADAPRDAVDAGLDDLVCKGRIVVEIEPDPALPLIAPPIVRYRPVALKSGVATPGEGGGRG